MDGENSSDDEGNFQNQIVDSTEENEKKNSPQNQNQNFDSGEFLIETNEVNNNNKDSETKEKEKEDNKKEENNNENKNKINSQSSFNLNKGNILNCKKRNDVIQIEIKEKTNNEHFTEYQLNLVNDSSNTYNSPISNNEKKILCYRRYKHFEIFYNTLKMRYPQYIFPRLSEKNILTKFKDDPIFIENRRKEIQYFINKLYFHDQIGKSEEFKQFINSSTFDEQYYNNLPKKYHYPECEKLNNSKGYWNIGVGKITSFFPKSKEERKKSEKENFLLKREDEFKKKYEEYTNLLKEIKILFECADEEIKEYKIVSKNILYMKDKKPNQNDKNLLYKKDIKLSQNESQDNKIKIKFNELINLNKTFAEIIEKHYIIYLAETIDQLNYCILDIEGINRALERYKKYLEEYKTIYEISEKNNKYVLEEKNNAENDKKEFEDCLYIDIIQYDKEINDTYINVIEKVTLYLKVINEENESAVKNTNLLD